MGCPASGGGAEDAFVVGFDSGVLDGNFLRVELDAADRAALEEAAPITKMLCRGGDVRMFREFRNDTREGEVMETQPMS